MGGYEYKEGYNENCPCCLNRLKKEHTHKNEVHLLYLSCELVGVFKNRTTAEKILKEEEKTMEIYTGSDNWIETRTVRED